MTRAVHGRDRRPSGPRHIARVTAIVIAKGFAFLKTPDGTEYFLHQSSSLIPLAELREGDLLSFAEITSTKGQRAVDARRLTVAEEEAHAASYGNR